MAFVEAATAAGALSVERDAANGGADPKDGHFADWWNMVLAAFPSPQDHVYPPELTLALAEFCNVAEDTAWNATNPGGAAGTAFAYLDASFSRASADSPARGEIAVGALEAAHRYVELTNEQFDFVPLLDAIDRYFPPKESPAEDPDRVFISTMGGCCSTMIIQGIADDDIYDRCVRYWDENLLYAAASPIDASVGPLEGAYYNAAVARNLRYQRTVEQGMDGQADLDEALAYAREAMKLGGESPWIRTVATFAWLLHLAAERGAGFRRQAVAQQLRLLETVFGIEDLDERVAALEEVVQLTFPVDPDEDRRCHMLLLEAWQAVASSTTASAYDSFTCALKVVDSSGPLAQGEREAAAHVVQAVESALLRVIPIAANVDGRNALALVQGLSSAGAVAAGILGEPDRSLQILERGATLRVDLQAGAHPPVIQNKFHQAGGTAEFSIRNFRPGLHYSLTPSSGTATIDGHGRVRVTGASAGTITLQVEVHGKRLDLTSAILDPEQLRELTVDLADPIIYLAATNHTGLAVVLWPHKTTEIVWLPSLTQSSIEEWLTRLDESTGELFVRGRQRKGRRNQSRVPIRGPRGMSAPSRETVDSVLSASAEAVRPLVRILEEVDETINLVVVGPTAGVPWTAVFSSIAECRGKPATVNPSATLLSLASTATLGNGPPVAITAPQPCTDVEGNHLPFLPYASEEGAYLSGCYGVDHFTGRDAIRDQYMKAIDSNPRFLHLGVHGSIDPDEFGSAHLIWASEPPAGSGITSLDEVSSVPTSCGLVFLAACSGGTPNRVLPDESISFPTAFLRAGVATIIAPLWPIEDATAKAFAVKFYDNWIGLGFSAAEALQRACSQLQVSRRHHNATWAAFYIAGRNQYFQDS